MKKLVFSILACLLTLFVHADDADPQDSDTWQVTANDYQYSMTITTALVFNMEESRDVNDIIAAFVGNDCRGVSQPITYIPESDRYLAHLLVYSNSVSGDEVTLYMYDQSDSSIVEVAEKVDFASNATYGSTDDPYLSITTFDVDFRVLANSDTLEGATVFLDGYGEKTTDSLGKVSYLNVTPADSIYFSVEKEGYDLFESSIAVIDSDVELTVDIEMTTYPVSFSIIDGKIPVENARIYLEGYSIKTTDVYGSATFGKVGIKDSITYEIIHDDFYSYDGYVDVSDTAVFNKFTLNRKSFNAILSIKDGIGPIENASVAIDVSKDDRILDFDDNQIPESFSTSGNNNWTINNSKSFQGMYALESGQIYDNQFTELLFTEDMVAGYFSFYTKISSEHGNDYLIFYIDGEEKARWSGNVDWVRPRYEVSSGKHTFKWVYQKDGTSSAGDDRVWIDYIQMPSLSMKTLTTTSNADGRALFTNMLPYPDTLFFEADHEDYKYKKGYFKMNNQDTTIDVVMLPIYNINFKVHAASNTGSVNVKNAYITLSDPQRDGTTDSFGEITFEEVTPADSILYSVIAEGYYDTSGVASVIDGDINLDVTLRLESTLHATNFISPNGDGNNDYWEIYDVERYDEFKVKIFSASGELIYETINYGSNKWDGKVNGNAIPDGIYYYILTSPLGDIVFKGIINLVN